MRAVNTAGRQGNQTCVFTWGLHLIAVSFQLLLDFRHKITGTSTCHDRVRKTSHTNIFFRKDISHLRFSDKVKRKTISVPTVRSTLEELFDSLKVWEQTKTLHVTMTNAARTITNLCTWRYQNRHINAQQLVVPHEQDGTPFLVVWNAPETFFQLASFVYRQEHWACETVHRLGAGANRVGERFRDVSNGLRRGCKSDFATKS